MTIDINTVYQVIAIPMLLFIAQDYVRFRFAPPYMTPQKCKEQKASCEQARKAHEKSLDKVESSQEKDLDTFRHDIDARMKRLEDRFDRFEGLIMVMMRPSQGGRNGEFPN